MTRLFAIDTSSWWSGLALVEAPGSEPGRTVAEVGLHVRETHTAHLLGLYERLLAEAGWSKTSVDAFATCRGPGSFTGVRVGLGTVRGLALASGRPALGIDSLVAAAEAFGPVDRMRMPILDAGRGEVYAALYDAVSSPPQELVAPWVGSPERALERPSGDAWIFGTGADVYAESLSRRDARLSPARAPRHVAAAIGQLALLRFAAGAKDGEGIAPLYLRLPDAIVKPR